MAKKKKQRGAVPIETVTDPYRESVIDEMAKLDSAIDELDAQIKAAVAGRAHLAAIRSCLKDGLLNRPTQMEYAFAEPTIELPELPAG
jgi:hypothetical protein